jgi:hypothetical protein
MFGPVLSYPERSRAVRENSRRAVRFHVLSVGRVCSLRWDLRFSPTLQHWPIAAESLLAEDLSREGTNTSYKQTGAIMQIFTLITPCDKRDWRFIPEFPRVSDCLCSDKC